jgi:hypothetical protein
MVLLILKVTFFIIGPWPMDVARTARCVVGGDWWPYVW